MVAPSVTNQGPEDVDASAGQGENSLDMFRLQPAGQEPPWRHDGEYVHVRVTTPDGHAMVVVEHD